MYLDSLKDRLQDQGIDFALFNVSGRATTLEGKFPIQRLSKALLTLPQLTKYNIIHVQFTFPLGLFYALSKRMHCKPVIIHVHGYDVFSLPSEGYGMGRTRFGRILAEGAWAEASKIIVVCNKAKRELSTRGVPPDKIDVLYNGVDVDLFHRNGRTSGSFGEIRENSELVFLNVGSLTPVKNQETLLRAFGLFVKNNPLGRRSKLVICGSGPLRDRLVAISKQLDIDRNVLFLGQQPHDKLPQVYGLADVFILPSLSEAHPWSLLEAMSCELPSIASAVGGIPETIDDERLLVAPQLSRSDAISDIYKKMVFLAEDAKRRRTIGTRNRKIVLDKFTFEQHVAKLRLSYMSLLYA